METLSTDGPGCDLARKKKRSFSPGSDVRDDKIPSFPSPSRGSITHSFTLKPPQSPSRSALAVSLLCALGSCVTSHLRIPSSDSDPTVPRVRRLGVSSGTVRRLLKASSRHPAARERARLLTSCPLHRPPSLPTSKTRILLCDDTIAPPRTSRRCPSSSQRFSFSHSSSPN